MAYITIPALPAGTALTGLEQFESVQSSVSVKLTANQMKTFVSVNPTFTVSDAATNTVSNAAIFQHDTSGTVAAGFGTGIQFNSENAVGAIVDSMDIQSICTNPASAAEAFDYALRLIVAGASTEVARITSTYRLGLGTSTPSATFHGIASDTNLNTVTTGLRLEHLTSSGSAGNGIGVGIDFVAENNAGVAKLGANIQAIEVDVGTGAEDFDLAFNLMLNGASPTEVMRLKSTGRVGIGTANPNTELEVLFEDATTNAAVTVARFTHATSGSPAVGIGTAIDFSTETSSNVFRTGGAIYSEARNVGLGVEDFDMAFALMIDGTAGTEVMRITNEKFFGINTATPTTSIQAVREDAATNTVTPMLRLTHTTSNTPAIGIGTSIQFETETSNGNSEIGGVIESVASVVSALTEEFNMVFRTMSAGAAASEKLRVGEVIYTPQHMGIGVVPDNTAWLHTGAGTATTATFDLDPGVLLTTPFTGAFEFEGKSLYFTPNGTERAVLQAAQMYQLNADRTGNGAITTIQSIFGKAVAVQAGTRYQYEVNVTITNTAATAKALQYALATGATLTAHDYEVISTNATTAVTPASASVMQNRITTGFNTLVNVTATSGASAVAFTARIRGSFDVSVAGTVDFSFGLTAVGTAVAIVAGSNVALWPVGSSAADTQIGNWT
jgi:hypothetical protein